MNRCTGTRTWLPTRWRIGLGTAFDVTVVRCRRLPHRVIAGADLMVVGGQTHVHGMRRASTRKAAVQAADKPGSGLKAEPDAQGPGLREWFSSLGRVPVKAAALDTRYDGPVAFTGQASKRVTRLLRAHGFSAAIRPESFLVTKQNQLVAGESARRASGEPSWPRASGRGANQAPRLRNLAGTRK